jgi:predicted Rossmann fold nucleotide-binding protein DprA/Smf involved in DNA uptake
MLGSEPIHPDEICASSGLPLSGVLTALMELELSGYAEQTEGKNYILA